MQLNQYHGPLYVLSAFRRYGSPGINRDNHIELKDRLKAQGVSYTDCRGKYQGEIEDSLILKGTHQMVAHHYATIYYQECFLRLEPHRDNMYKAYVIDTATGAEEYAGYFRSFSENVILQLRLDYTKDSNGNYFSIWHSDKTDLAEHMHEIGEELIRTMEKLGG